MKSKKLINAIPVDLSFDGNLDLILVLDDLSKDITKREYQSYIQSDKDNKIIFEKNEQSPLNQLS